MYLARVFIIGLYPTAVVGIAAVSTGLPGAAAAVTQRVCVCAGRLFGRRLLSRHIADIHHVILIKQVTPQ